MVKGLRVARVSGMSMTQSSAPLSRNASPPFTCSIGVNCAITAQLLSCSLRFMHVRGVPRDVSRTGGYGMSGGEREKRGRVVEISGSSGADKHLQHHAGLAGSH